MSHTNHKTQNPPSPLISKGEGARRAGEGVLSTYTPFELAKQYDTTPQEDKRVHYPHLLAPPSLRTSNLPSYRPSRFLNPVLWTFVTLGRKEREQQMREYMWKTELPCNPSRTLTPDSVTDYEYDYDNRLVEVSLPTNSDSVEYTYDAMGRRLTKKFTYHNGTNTDVTTYKYHYIGGQITEIEIDAIRNPGEGQSVLRNEEVKIHLGANSQPISYEWVKHVGESTTSATYHYHYDIHGNVLKITDSSENTKITYTYDVLGKILTETNPDSVLNFFTFRGASQTIWDNEVGMYYSGGYYRPDTGTALQGTGAPVLTSPASGSMINTIALSTTAYAQMMLHTMISASSAGSSSGGRPGGFAPPPGPRDGVSRAGRASPPPNPEPPPALVGYGGGGQNVYTGGTVVYYDSEIGNYVVVPPPKRVGIWETRDPKTGKKTGYIIDDNYFGEDTIHKQNICGDNAAIGGDTSHQYAEAVEVIDDQMPQNSGAGKVFESTEGGESLPYTLVGAGKSGQMELMEIGGPFDWWPAPINGSWQQIGQDFKSPFSNRERKWNDWAYDKLWTNKYPLMWWKVGGDLANRKNFLEEMLGYSVQYTDRILNMGYNNLIRSSDKRGDLALKINELVFKYLNDLVLAGAKNLDFDLTTFSSLMHDPRFDRAKMEKWIISELTRLGYIGKGPRGGKWDPVIDPNSIDPINIDRTIRITPAPPKFDNNSWW